MAEAKQTAGQGSMTGVGAQQRSAATDPYLETAATSQRLTSVATRTTLPVRQQAAQTVTKSHAATKRQLHILDTTLASITDFAYTFGPDGRFLYANQPLLNLLGLTLPQIIGKNFFDLPYPPALAAQLQDQIQQVFATQASVVDETPFTSPAGVNGYYEYIFNPAMAVNGTVEFVAGSTRDITARKASEAEREQLLKALAAERAQLQALTATLEQRVEERTTDLADKNRELERFAYVAAHDLKAPLRGIRNLANWIETETAGVLPSTAQAYLTKLQKRVKSLERLVEDLLAYARVGRIRYDVERVHTPTLLQDVLEILAPASRFTVTWGSAMPSLVTARVPLETVFLNLIGHALKHYEQAEAGQIQITAQDQGQLIEFVVQDNGPGLDPAQQARIFDLFQLGRPPTKSEESGLELAIVKKIIDTYGGTIQAESQLGEGATFRFTWPKA